MVLDLKIIFISESTNHTELVFFAISFSTSETFLFSNLDPSSKVISFPGLILPELKLIKSVIVESALKISSIISLAIEEVILPDEIVLSDNICSYANTVKVILPVSKLLFIVLPLIKPSKTTSVIFSPSSSL